MDNGDRMFQVLKRVGGRRRDRNKGDRKTWYRKEIRACVKLSSRRDWLVAVRACVACEKTRSHCH